MDLARAPRRAPLTARKKGSGYENAFTHVYHSRTQSPSYARSTDGDEGRTARKKGSGYENVMYI